MKQIPPAMMTAARTTGESGGWYEVRPYFEPVDAKYADMYEVVTRIREFSHFIVRLNDEDDNEMTRIFMHLPNASEARVVQGVLKNALMERVRPKEFSASSLVYLKMRRHYAIPVAHELMAPLVYAAIEKTSSPCFIALTARYRDESYSISQFIEKIAYNKKSLLGSVLEMFVPSSSGTNSGGMKRSTSPHRLMQAELAKEKQRLRHFHCTVAIGSQDVGAARSIMKVLVKGDGFAIDAVKMNSTYTAKVKKPVVFANHFCVLSEIELANIMALPDNPRAYRFNISKKGTFTSGPTTATTTTTSTGT